MSVRDVDNDPDPNKLSNLFLQHYNHNVPYYLWILIGCLIGVAIIIHLISEVISRRRRRGARHQRPPCPPQVKYCTRHVPNFCLALFRKATVTRSRFADILYLGSIGEVLLISAYIAANIVLMLVHSELYALVQG